MRLFGILCSSALLLLAGMASHAQDITPPPRAIPVEEDTPSVVPPPPRAMLVEDEPPQPAPTQPPPVGKPEEPKKKPAVKLPVIPPTPEPPPKPKKDLSATWMTQKDARTLRLEIPAPRGQIVDRHGKPFARNVVVYFAAFNFPLLTPDRPEAILAYARERITQVNTTLGKQWTMSDERILQHYKHRRWLPMVFSADGDFNTPLTVDEQLKLKPLLDNGLMLHPTYQREYPQGATACHMIGYTGRRQPLPTKEIVEGEPFAEEPMGRSGLELKFEDQLRGTPGSISLLFSPSGELLRDEILRKPVPGHNVVTTLDYKIQRYAESALRDHASNGGAMVIANVKTGEILAMASNPGFDLNEFIPGISSARYKELSEDPRLPLFGRAYQGSYFPASTFKIVTALAGLESGAVTPATTFDCDGVFYLGKESFRNWRSADEGPMAVVEAIKRSCNTWFYQAGLATGASKVVGMAERMGFGQPTGIPIPGESKGFVPTDAYYMQRYGHKILPGFLCSIAIGQIVECSPLQATQCMAAVADGMNMPQLRLVSQVQDLNDRVVQAWEPAVRTRVALDQKARDTVVKGMIEVVSGSNGTGSSAGISQAQIAGKTGTAQWKIFKDDSKNKNLAWFTGFVPANNPVYAFAAVYEGAPGESVSGGKSAAPIVRRVFNNIYENAEPDDPLLIAGNAPPRALEVDDIDADAVASGPPQQPAQSAAPPAAPAPPPVEHRGLRGIFRKLFRR